MQSVVDIESFWMEDYVGQIPNRGLLVSNFATLAIIKLSYHNFTQLANFMNYYFFIF